MRAPGERFSALLGRQRKLIVNIGGKSLAARALAA